MSSAPANQMSDNNNNEDTEVTLGTGKMLGLFFGLVILCAIFFGMGYSMGKNAVKSTTELLPSPGTSSGTHSIAGKPSSTPAPAPETQEVVQQQSVPPAYSTSTAPASTTPQSAPATTAPSAPEVGYFVQVAAVSNQEDAE